MELQRDDVVDRLRAVLTEIGGDGGLVTPSVYDTAVVLHAGVLPEQAQREMLAWLLRQQHADGGFGLTAVPMARDLPTLAVVVALHAFCDSQPRVREAYMAALGFLGRHAAQWGDSLPDDIPVGLELLLPWLVDRAVALGIPIEPPRYAALYQLGERRRALIRRMAPGPGSAPAHSWEGWGTLPAANLLDASGSIGHSPAATAVWLKATRGRDDLANERARALRYLKDASECTGASVVGVVPTVWPIDRFEQVWALYALGVLGLLHHPHVRDLADRQLRNLASAMRPEGLGMSDAFTVDGDITSTALATLAEAGIAPAIDVLRRFERDGTYITYQVELQPSLTTNAHALHALIRLGQSPPEPAQRFLLQRQQGDGRWIGDKWHSSWLYTTTQVAHGLATAGHEAAQLRALDSVLRTQRADGSWGHTPDPTAAETSYAMLFLCKLRTHPALHTRVAPAIDRARAWLMRNPDVGSKGADRSWIGKELYCPVRVDRAWVYSALLAAQTEVHVSDLPITTSQCA
jgi:halimadienyl-diphosphate synthase